AILVDSGTLNITDYSTLSGNTTGTNGGAIGGVGTISIVNSTLSNNYAAGAGGVIMRDGGSGTLTIDSSLFRNNSTSSGGAININAGTVNITNSEFASNTVTNRGGAIFAQNTPTLNISGSLFTG